jgi:hypothetical protein
MMTSPRLTFKYVQAEAQKRHLLLCRVSGTEHGFYLDIDPNSGLSWNDFPHWIAQHSQDRFSTLSRVMDRLNSVDQMEDYDCKAFAIVQDAKQWLERTGNSTDERTIQRLLETAIRHIPDLRKGEINQYNEQAQQRLNQWIAANGILDEEEVCKEAGFLIRKQLETACALKIIRIARPPDECRLKDESGKFEADSWFTIPLANTELPAIWDTGYYHPFILTIEHLKTINDETLVSHKEAAEILCATEQQFTRLREADEIKPATERRSRRNRYLYYLYRLSDVLRINRGLREAGE